MLAKSLTLATGLAALTFAFPASAFQLDTQHPVGTVTPGQTGSQEAAGFIYDDGSAENALGLTAGGQMAWLHSFNAGAGGALLTHVDTAVGSANGSFPPAGGALTIYVWNDPNNDGNPSDAVLLATGSGVIVSPGTDTIVQYNLDTPVTVTNKFFVGAMVAQAAGTFPGPMDESQASAGRAWVVGSTTSNFNPNSLPGNDVAPVELDSIGFPAVWLLRAGGPTWLDLGGGLAGGAGTPALAGAGATSGGQTVTITLSGAAANASATLVTGLSALNAPFKGGVLVPNPDIILGGLSTDGAGGLALSGSWPTFLSPGRVLVFQYWIVDGGAPQGLAASNGLSGTTQ